MLAKDVAASRTAAKRVDTIKSASERAASLTAQLLAFSRRQILQPKVLNLNLLVSDTGKMLHRLLGEDIEQEMALDPSLGHVKENAGSVDWMLKEEDQDALAEAFK